MEGGKEELKAECNVIELQKKSNILTHFILGFCAEVAKHTLGCCGIQGVPPHRRCDLALGPQPPPKYLPYQVSWDSHRSQEHFFIAPGEKGSLRRHRVHASVHARAHMYTHAHMPHMHSRMHTRLYDAYAVHTHAHTHTNMLARCTHAHMVRTHTHTCYMCTHAHTYACRHACTKHTQCMHVHASHTLHMHTQMHTLTQTCLHDVHMLHTYAHIHTCTMHAHCNMVYMHEHTCTQHACTYIHVHSQVFMVSTCQCIHYTLTCIYAYMYWLWRSLYVYIQIQRAYAFTCVYTPSTYI